MFKFRYRPLGMLPALYIIHLTYQDSTLCVHCLRASTSDWSCASSG